MQYISGGVRIIDNAEIFSCISKIEINICITITYFENLRTGGGRMGSVTRGHPFPVSVG